ncbi:hypothetical protein GCM10011273_10780 [Asticcacaulis endophyticus]|uniref:DUF2971 domain-containing protein n=2 Tax=Asticcacaulis endophyticus TaxID=1395890 RepID=A0A918UQE2_9CAUL|nr:hypothetical protein GCM10011273_10780 [Asticcacaulis endophyticus]
MRNARNMNDLSEVEHGKVCLLRAYHNSEIGGRLQGFLDGIYPGFSQRLIGRFNESAPQFEDDTYLTCLSEHYPHEDAFGRLSMWRAYAPKDGVALVVKSAPFQADNRRLGAYSSPVFYGGPEAFSADFNTKIDEIISERHMIEATPEHELQDWRLNMFLISILCTKHKAFDEEREWRIIYSPADTRSEVITSRLVTLNGVPQKIQIIPLRDDPANGLDGTDLPNFLERIIIGPTSNPETLRKTFIEILANADVPDPENRVFTSSIPLRMT